MNHELLCRKLTNQFNFTNSATAYKKYSDLSNRSLYVRIDNIDNIHSNLFCVFSGVPQVSVLGSSRLGYFERITAESIQVVANYSNWITSIIEMKVLSDADVCIMRSLCTPTLSEIYRINDEPYNLNWDDHDKHTRCSYIDLCCHFRVY